MTVGYIGDPQKDALKSNTWSLQSGVCGNRTLGDPTKLNCSHWLEKNKLETNFTLATLGELGMMAGGPGYHRTQEV